MKILQETRGRLARLLECIVKFFKAKREIGRNDTFVCPKCGGNYFGTKDTSRPTNEWVRHCNGWRIADGQQVRCNFEWPLTDDWYYFVPRA